uniref:Uncharacterized protein n=1 Tax=Anguilla anguilla TaxID=7936 RepID=A0A0E9PHN7_ANGAN
MTSLSIIVSTKLKCDTSVHKYGVLHGVGCFRYT